MNSLSEQTLQPCIKADALSDIKITQHLNELSNWKILTNNNVKQIHKTYEFKNFVTALAFSNQIGELAEAENHHPKICTEWGKVTISWWTHTVNGLFINDFIMAARCDKKYKKTTNNSTTVG